MEQHTIRPLQPDDIPVLAGWIAATPLWQRYQFTVPKIESGLQGALVQGDILLVADTESAQAVGLAWCLKQGAFGRSPYLRLLGVSATQHGLGAALLTYLEQQLTEKTLFLLVSDFNESAQRFYQRQGYTQIGALPGYVLPDVTELLYWKKISTLS